MCFRKDKYAVSADNEQMFYSFYVREDHRNYLRFLWYSLCVHVFGNTASPAVATFGLRKTVENCEDSDVKGFVNKNFYVDDGLVSLPTSEKAIDLMKRTQNVFKKEGNIKLHKITSSSSEVISAFNSEDRSFKSLEVCQS